MYLNQLLLAYGISAPSLRVTNEVNDTDTIQNRNREGILEKTTTDNQEVINTNGVGINATCDSIEGNMVLQNPIMQQSGHTGRLRTFTEALSRSSEVVPIRPLPPPRFEGGNIIVEVDEEDYANKVLQCQFDVIGRIILQRGDNPYMTLELFDKLVILWGIQNFKSFH